MTTARDERVLVIPTAALRDAGPFQGFTADVGRYLPVALDPARLLYLPRAAAEQDPTHKQIIPYVVFRSGGLLFNYVRGRSGTEARLRALRSLGVGGHVCDEDGPTPLGAYHAAIRRELEEEVSVGGACRETCLGLINDDRTPVGQVHVGIVHLFDLETPSVRPREDALAEAGFHPLGELRGRRGEFETWSQFLLDPGVLGP